MSGKSPTHILDCESLSADRAQIGIKQAAVTFIFSSGAKALFRSKVQAPVVRSMAAAAAFSLAIRDRKGGGINHTREKDGYRGPVRFWEPVRTWEFVLFDPERTLVLGSL